MKKLELPVGIEPNASQSINQSINQEALGLIPTGGSSFFIHLLLYHSKE